MPDKKNRDANYNGIAVGAGKKTKRNKKKTNKKKRTHKNKKHGKTVTKRKK